MPARAVVHGLLLFGLLVAGCPSETDAPKTRATARSPANFEVPPDIAKTRYMKVLRLLERPKNDRRRATQLFRTTKPLCTSEAARREFLETTKWSLDHADEQFFLPSRVTLDMLEHVASVCGRQHVDGALDLLRSATTLLDDPRLFVIIARTEAVAGRYEAAAVSARRAASLGSAHAVVLEANILARAARASRPGFEAGMLGPALAVANREPVEDWPIIDLAALLSTRARLRLEQGFWTDGEASGRSRLAASQAFERLLLGPFPTDVQGRAADALCFETVDLQLGSDACKQAGRVHGHLGAAVSAEVPPREPKRRDALVTLGQKMKGLKAGALAVWIVRGDEQELIEWGRPAARLLVPLRKAGARVLVVDRTGRPRTTAYVDRVLRLAGLRAWRRIDGNHPGTTPCLAAVLAQRKPPAGCPLRSEDLDALRGAGKPELFLLLGRHLDTDIEDLRLYEHPVALASLRISEKAEGDVEAWLKSLSDVWVVSLRPQTPSPPP